MVVLPPFRAGLETSLRPAGSHSTTHGRIWKSGGSSNRGGVNPAPGWKPCGDREVGAPRQREPGPRRRGTKKGRRVGSPAARDGLSCRSFARRLAADRQDDLLPLEQIGVEDGDLRRAGGLGSLDREIAPLLEDGRDDPALVDALQAEGVGRESDAALLAQVERRIEADRFDVMEPLADGGDHTLRLKLVPTAGTREAAVPPERPDPLDA